MVVKQKMLSSLNDTLANQIDSEMAPLVLKDHSDAVSTSWQECSGKIEELNRNWHILKQQISTNTSVLEELQAKEVEFHNQVRIFFTRATKLHSVAQKLWHKLRQNWDTVQQAIKDLEVSAKSGPIPLKKAPLKLTFNFQTLKTSANEARAELDAIRLYKDKFLGSPRHPLLQQMVLEGVQKSERQFDELTVALAEVGATLSLVEEQWKTYQKALHTVQHCLTEIQYTFDLYRVPSTEVSAFQSQCFKLCKLKDDFQTNETFLEILKDEARRLTASCDPTICKDINNTVTSVLHQWESTKTLLTETSTRYETVLDLWQRYVSEYDYLVKLIDSRQAAFQKLLVDQPESDENHMDQCEVGFRKSLKIMSKKN